MTGGMEEPQSVSVDRLQVGVFISLAERWLDHPFLFNEFRISSEKQIRTLREMGLGEVKFYPSRSTAQPLQEERPPPPGPAPVQGPDPAELAALEAKRLRVARVASTRERLARCEKAYARTAGEVRKLMHSLHAAPAQAAQAAQALVSETVAAFAADQDAVLHLMSQQKGDENAYFHVLNVTILSLLLGQGEGLDEVRMHALGMGALFHDLGKVRVPDPVLRKGADRNRTEETFYRLHCQYGAALAAEVGTFSPASIAVMLQHHEHMDGTGFPAALKGEAISLEGRIVGLCNRYDGLCNGPSALTPAEALSLMYSRERKWWDERLLARFIKALGVYPPGSIVQLSNGAIGLVVAVNRAEPLRPSVLLYDASIPRGEAIIVDLVDAPEVAIDTALRRGKVAAEVLDYLAPRQRVTYFYDRSAG